MKLDHIAFQSLRNDTGALFAHIGISPGCREPHALPQMVFIDILHADINIIYP